MWRPLPDGWCDESDEGPYTELLHTRDDWSIVRGYPLYRDDSMFTLKLHNSNFEKKFMTVEDAKAYVTDFEAIAKVETDKQRKSGYLI